MATTSAGCVVRSARSNARAASSCAETGSSAGSAKRASQPITVGHHACATGWVAQAAASSPVSLPAPPNSRGTYRYELVVACTGPVGGSKDRCGRGERVRVPGGTAGPGLGRGPRGRGLWGAGVERGAAAGGEATPSSESESDETEWASESLSE